MRLIGIAQRDTNGRDMGRCYSCDLVTQTLPARNRTRHRQDRRYYVSKWASTFFIRQTFEGRSPSRWRSYRGDRKRPFLNGTL